MTQYSISLLEGQHKDKNMMKNQLIQHLKKHGCIVIRENGDCAIYENPSNGRRASVDCDVGIDSELAREICQQLDIPP
jgi:predicted RNA binding protein YcfA (HicA-like mRNA interferase family)